MVELIALSVFVAIALLTVGLVALTGGGKSSSQRRLMTVTAEVGELPSQRGMAQPSGRLSLAADLVEKIGFWTASRFETDQKDKNKDETFQLLSYAGWRGQRAGAIFMGSRVLCALGLAAVGLIGALTQEANAGTITIMILGALAGYYIPKLFLNFRVNARKVGITKSLPDVLDMMIICVEAGLGLNAAFDRVAAERTRINPLDLMGNELKYMTYELQAGVARDQAFHNLGQRNGVDDLKALAAFMVQSEKLGGSLVEALKIYAAELRTRRRQRAQEQANKAAVKLLFPLVLFIFPTMFIVILAPAVMQLTASMKDLR